MQQQQPQQQQFQRDRTRRSRSIAPPDGRTTLHFRSILYERRTQSLPSLALWLSMNLKSRNLDSFSGASRNTMSILSVTSALSGLSHSSSSSTTAASSADHNISYGDGTNPPLDELIETENSFVHKLDLLETEFRRRLQATLHVKCAKPLLSATFIDEVFGLVEEIRGHNSNLLKDLQRLRARGYAKLLCRVPKLLHTFSIELIDSYCNYASSLQASTYKLKMIRKQNEDVEAFFRVSEICAGETFDSLRIAPIQRVPRYVLLLKELMRELGEDSNLYYPLQETTESLKHMIREIDASIDTSLRLHRTFLVQQDIFGGRINLVSGQRGCIRSGTLTKLYSRTSRHIARKQSFFFILFTDSIAYAAASGSNPHRLKHVLPLHHMRLHNINEKLHDDIKNAWRIVSTNKSIVVQAPTPELKESWMRDINMAVKQATPLDKIDDILKPMGQELEKDWTLTQRRGSLAASNRSDNRMSSVFKFGTTLRQRR